MRRGKSLIGLFVSLLLALPWAAGAQENAATRVWPSASLAAVSAGQEFEVNVLVEGATQVYGASFTLAYDPAALDVITDRDGVVERGAFFGDRPHFLLKNARDGQRGSVEYALTLVQPAEPVSGAGVLGTVRFRALADVPVAVALTEAALVSPQFAQVDGRIVAQQMNAVQPVIGDLVVAAQTAQSEVVAPSAPASSAAAQPGAVTVSVGAAAAQPAVAAPSANNPIVIIITGVLLLAGVLLLLLSIGMYTRMRTLSSAGSSWVE